MERLIAYDKLAREDRLVRMRAREVAQLKVDQGLPPFPDLLSRDSIKERVHGIMVGELQAMEGAGRTVYDFPDAPWEFTMDMARQVWDESRHVEIYVRLLEHLDGYIGEFPETTILWRCACAAASAAKVPTTRCRSPSPPRPGARAASPTRRSPASSARPSAPRSTRLPPVPSGYPTMTHPLAGFLEVDESARTVRHYRYVTERMMRILGGWIALTPELSAKLLFGRHVWDNAQHADAWGKRLPEL